MHTLSLASLRTPLLSLGQLNSEKQHLNSCESIDFKRISETYLQFSTFLDTLSSELDLDVDPRIKLDFTSKVSSIYKKYFKSFICAWNDLRGPRLDLQNLCYLFGSICKLNVICSDKIEESGNANGMLTKKDLFRILHLARRELIIDEEMYGSFILCFSGHGKNQSIICSDGQEITTLEIQKYFGHKNIPHLRDAVKICYVSFCFCLSPTHLSLFCSSSGACC